MDKNTLKTIKLTEKHTKNIESIWISSLPENLKSMIGGILIERYLYKFFQNDKNLGIGIFNGENLLGFVLFGDDSKITSLLIKEKFFLIIKTFIHSLIFLNVKKIKNFVDCLIYILLSKKKENVIRKNNTELLIICVSQYRQKNGIGSYLLEECFQNYKSYFEDYSNVFVKTLNKNPKNISFYEKNKFNYVFEVFGRVYLERKIN
jgi:ribosomal protein S18 acetylase RimI-like enzyme